MDTTAPTNTTTLTEIFASMANDPKKLVEVRKILAKDEGLRRMLYKSKQPRGPYYNADYGLQLKPYLDDLILNPNMKIVLKLKNFPTLNLDTLYLRTQQSFRWLAEAPQIIEQHGDKYAKLYEQTRIHRDRKHKEDQHVFIHFKVKSNVNLTPLPAELELADPPLDTHAWRTKLDDWLSDPKATPNPFVLRDLQITEDEVEALDIELNQLAGIMARVRVDQIKVVRSEEPVTSTK